MTWKNNELHTIHNDKPLFMGFVYAATLRDDEWYAVGRYSGSYYPQMRFHGPHGEYDARLWLANHCAKWLKDERNK